MNDQSNNDNTPKDSNQSIAKTKKLSKSKLKNPKESFGFDISDEELSIIDINLLGKYTDRDLAKKWGIHRTKILRIRNRLNIPACKFDYHIDEKLQTIIKFLKDNENNIITIQEFYKLGIFMINKKLLTKDAIKEIAEKNNIKVIFKNDKTYEHCHNNYVKGCRCDICKLSMAIYIKYTRVVSISFCNFLANEYVALYKQDTTRFHRLFYSFVEEEIEKVMETEKPDPQVNVLESVNTSTTNEKPEKINDLADKVSIKKELAKNDEIRQELLRLRYVKKEKP